MQRTRSTVRGWGLGAVLLAGLVSPAAAEPATDWSALRQGGFEALPQAVVEGDVSRDPRGWQAALGALAGRRLALQPGVELLLGPGVEADRLVAVLRVVNPAAEPELGLATAEGARVTLDARGHALVDDAAGGLALLRPGAVSEGDPWQAVPAFWAVDDAGRLRLRFAATAQRRPLLARFEVVFLAEARKAHDRNGDGRVTLDELLLPAPPERGGTATVTATLQDAFSVDSDSDNRADPGDELRYTATIEASGAAAATGVQFNDPLDSDTTLVAGSVDVSPLAFDDSYAAVGNVTLNVTSPASGFLANDLEYLGNPAATLTSPTPGVPTATTGGGTVTVQADGTFAYTTPAGASSGTDTFTYTIADIDNPSLTSTGTVTFNIAGRVWFVKSDVAGPGTGTQTDPFKLLATVNGAGGAGDPDAPSDYLYLHDSTALNDHVDGIVLEPNQKLVGAGVALTVGSVVVLPAGTAPTLVHTGGHAITLATGASVDGLVVAAANNAAIAGSGALGTVSIGAGTTLSTSGNAIGLSLSSHSGTVTMDGAVNGSGSGAGVSLSGGNGVLTMTGALTKTAGPLLSVQGKTGGSASFGTVSGSGAAGDSIVLQSNTGGTLLNFGSGLSVNTTNGRGLVAANAGTLNIAGTASTISASGGAGLDISGTSLGAGATFASVTSSGSSAEGLRLVNVSGPLTINGGALSGSTGTAFSVSQGSAAVGYAGSIAKTSAGLAVDVQARTGGTITLSGPVVATGASSGVNVGGATVASTVSFTGAVDLGTSGARLLGGTALTVNHGGTGSTTSFSDLDVFTTGKPGIDASNGGTLNITTGSVDAGGRALNLDNLAAGVTLGALTSAGSVTEGVRLNALNGSLSIGSTTVTNPQTQGLLVQGTSAATAFGPTQVSGTGTQRILITNSTGNADFGATTLSGGTDGLSLQSNSAGTRTFASLTISGNSGLGLLHATGGGVLTVTGNATITNPGGTGADIQNSASSVTFGSLTVNKGASAGTGVSLTGNTVAPSFGTLSITTSNGTGLSASSSGANSAAGSIAATNGPAINATGGTFNLVLAGAGSTNSTGSGLALTNTAGTLTIGGTGAISGAATTAVAISGGSSNIQYGGAVSHSSASRVASVTGRTSGSATLSGNLTGSGVNTGILVDSNGGTASVTFSGGSKTLSTGANPAVTLTNNGTANVLFSGGGLALTTTGGTGFNATGSGVVAVTGSGNTVTATTGTGVNLANVTYGASGVTFESVSVNGAANGIVINSVTTGGNSFSVTGTGTTAGSGGTLQNTTDDAVRVSSSGNVTLRNMNINNSGNAAGEHAVDLSSATSVTLERVSINGTADHGINAVGGSGLQLNSSTVLNAGNAANEHAVNLTNLGGSVTLDASTLDAAADDLLRVTNTNTNLTINVQNGSLLRNTGNTVINGNNGIVVTPNGTSAVALNVTGSSFTNVRGTAAQLGAAAAGSTGASSLTFTGNTVSATLANKGGSVVLSSTKSTTNTLTVSGNNWSNAKGPGLVTANAIESSTLNGVIKDNVITTGVDSVGIGVFVEDSATQSVTVHNNQINSVGSDGIQIANFGNNDGAATTATLNVRVTNNTINGHNSSTGGFAFIAGVSVFNFEDSLCLNLQNNAVTGTPLPVGVFFDYYLQRDAGTFRVQGAGTAAVTSAAIFGVLGNTGDSSPPGQSTPSAGVVGTINFSNGVACSTPAP